ncbi:MAG: nucleoside deaminase [Clostridiaceae bacterium]|nr:nucleoside deaminase [Clostridiaceae bacterium]
MQQALLEADLAEQNGDVPVGAIIVKSGQIIARGHNKREFANDVTAHAEIVAIRKACKNLQRWILDDCELYVTLEPCLMCFGAIIQARIANIYFGAYDPKTGACGSVAEIATLKDSALNHHTNIVGGLLEEECAKKLTDFFQKKRYHSKLNKINKQGGKDFGQTEK